MTDRRKYLGGSDIAAVLGLSPWKTPVALWADKIEPPGEDKHNVREKSRGKRWESVVGEMLTEELEANGHTVEIVTANQRYKDEQHPFFACEIDYELRLDGAREITNCELKTVHPFRAKDWGESGSDDLPTHYTAQAMWGLGVTRRSMCIVAPLFGADEIKIFPVLADAETIAAMRERALNFWTAHVMTRIAPDPITLDDMAKLFAKEIDDSILDADDELTAKILRLRAVDTDLKARKAEYDSLEFDIQRAMRDAAEIHIGGKSAITWKQRKHAWLDQQGLKSAHAKIHREFMRESNSRVFTLKNFAWR